MAAESVRRNLKGILETEGDEGRGGRGGAIACRDSEAYDVPKEISSALGNPQSASSPHQDGDC